MAFATNFSGSKQKTKHKTLLIADNYLDINELENRWHVLLRSASACTKPPFNDCIQAKSWLQLVIDEASKNRQPLFVGNALLILGELYFSQIRDNDNNAPGNEETLLCFKQAFELLQQGGHFFAEAKTMHRLGECMLKYGQVEGVEILYKSIEGLQKAHAYTEQQSIWRCLQIWHTRTGAQKRAKKAGAESQALSAIISLNMGEQVDALSQADLLFRQGRVTKVIESLGVYDINDELRKSELRVGLVGRPKGIDDLNGWLRYCQSFIEGKESKLPNLFRGFGGFSDTHGYYCKLLYGERSTRPIENSKIQNVQKIKDVEYEQNF